MIHELHGGRPLRRIHLQATPDEASELRRGGGRRLRWSVGVTRQRDRLPLLAQGEAARVELEDGEAEAPYVAGVAAAAAAGVVGAHVRGGAERRPAGPAVGRPVAGAVGAEPGDLDAPRRVDEQVGRPDVPVDDAAAVEVRDPGERLARDAGEGALVRDAAAGERPAAHVLEQDDPVLLAAAAAPARGAVAPHQGRVVVVVGVAAGGGGPALVEHLERVLPPRATVTHQPHLAGLAAVDEAAELHLSERGLHRGVEGRRRRRRRWRGERHGDVGARRPDGEIPAPARPPHGRRVGTRRHGMEEQLLCVALSNFAARMMKTSIYKRDLDRLLVRFGVE